MIQLIQDFILRFRKNFQESRNATVLIAAGSLIAIFVVWYAILMVLDLLDVPWMLRGMLLLNRIIFLAALGLAAYIVIRIGSRIPQLSWFWGYDMARVASQKQKASTSSNIKSATERVQDITAFCLVPRSTPKGTELVYLDENSAHMRVKSAIRFWCYFLPALFTIGAVAGVPLGGYWGFEIYNAQPNRWNINPTPYVFWGAVFLSGSFVAAAIYSYFATRPWLGVKVTPSTITYGSMKFDRRYYGGMQIGYSTNEGGDLKNGFFDLSLGMAALRLSYGPWGEDLKYLINKYHSAEIVNWMNGVIASVGAAPPPDYDPYAGRKIELL